mgnify:CR=1 FL=1
MRKPLRNGRKSHPVAPLSERALLVGVGVKKESSLWSLGASLEELGRLAQTAGAQVVGTVSQGLERPSAYYVGRGKLQEVRELWQDLEYTTVIFDDELPPTQQRILEQALEVKVIDRTALILDVFARHARTREGRLQVELAQHKYLLPRLAGQWSHLERLGGGIGTRGPGESQLETDRRLARDRIHRLQQELESVRRHRALYRARRHRQGIPVVSLVGYTNAGKSTLFNRFTRAGVPTEDKLFATLDSKLRKGSLGGQATVVFVDTVGFIRKLPHHLVASFRSTLEEIAQADVVLHVIDRSHRQWREQMEVGEVVLADLGVDMCRVLPVFNKMDRCEADSGRKYGGFAVSAQTGAGVAKLKSHLAECVASNGYS